MTHSNPKMPTPVWTPSAQTKMAVPDFVAMHGGPRAMRLAEHEHSEIQIEAHFSPASLSKTSAAVPDVYHLIPSGKPHVGSWDEGSEVVVLLLGTQQLDLAGDELLRRGKLELEDEIWGADGVVQSLAGVLRRDFLSGTIDPFYLEAVRTVLSGHLARSFAASSPRPMRGRLSPQVLRRALEMIEARVDSGASLTIDELARHSQMGVHHFTQLFKASTGRTPYRFVVDARMARAKELLRTTSHPLAAIAYLLGFASQSHFSTSFRRHTQMTPQQFRRAARR